MRERRLRRITIALVVLVSLAVAGLSALVYAVERHHARTISDRVRALGVLATVDRANIVLDGQVREVTASYYRPLPRHDIRSQTKEIQSLLGNPELATSPAGHQLQREVLEAHRMFSERALTLPASPSLAEVAATQESGDKAAALLGSWRVLHKADLARIASNEEQLSRLSRATLVAGDAAVLILVAAGLLLLERLAREQTRSAALAATDQLRNEFVAFAAHELRNPAAVIKGGAWLLRSGNLPSEKREQIIDAIGQSADLLARLVYTLLTMGRIEEGRLKLNTSTVPLQDLIEEVVAEVETHYPGLQQRAQRSIPQVQVAADPDYLKLAISNLLDNAIKFSPPSSPVVITAEMDTGSVQLRIRDSGSGIPSERLPHIFEKYETYGGEQGFRGGVGLGLYMARLLVEAHGGTLEAASAVGQGTTMSITLPLPDQHTGVRRP